MTIELISAAHFTIQQLTELYNQTRVDYLVPMPMNAERLAEYVHDFDIDLTHSCIARSAEGEMLGLSMLGIRRNKAWVTRLGVLPASRRTGSGSAMMDFMLEGAASLGLKETDLEVIKNNVPAYNLFLRKGFAETSEYLVMRRAPHSVSEPLQGNVTWLEADEASETLQSYPRHLTWINAYESMRNTPNLQGLRLELPNGSSGWLVCRNTKFTLRSTLSHLIMHTEHGDPQEVGTQLLLNLHTRYPHHDTYAENIPHDDPHLTAFQTSGYFTNFSRIEMRRIIP
ncbi:MAG TPA: GNAT family N-acetyltransferase [Anaerolineales bacterium]|nr:GNAT family N-acetyltransferase [Anaerolineales bacterium]